MGRPAGGTLRCDQGPVPPESLARIQLPPAKVLLALPEAAPAGRPTCGRRHKKRGFLRPRIIGGSASLPGSHPWLAAIYIGDSFCAGSLVHTCWVASAAHCFSSRCAVQSPGPPRQPRRPPLRPAPAVPPPRSALRPPAPVRPHPSLTPTLQPPPCATHLPVLPVFCLTVTHVSSHVPTFPCDLSHSVAPLPVLRRRLTRGDSALSQVLGMEAAETCPVPATAGCPRPRALSCQALWVGRGGAMGACALELWAGPSPAQAPPRPRPRAAQLAPGGAGTRRPRLTSGFRAGKAVLGLAAKGGWRFRGADPPPHPQGRPARSEQASPAPAPNVVMRAIGPGGSSGPGRASQWPLRDQELGEG